MTSRKGDLERPAAEPHLLSLMSSLMDCFRQRILAEDLEGLRSSHFRVLASVPAEGISITDLAERLRMTKQGCGQFIAKMADLGVIQVVPDPTDRRTKRVLRTPYGEAVNARFERLVADTEHELARRVGPRRYATFRAVLRESAGR
jgi:DNA-binding MarR family transcriptional regulator